MIWISLCLVLAAALSKADFNLDSLESKAPRCSDDFGVHVNHGEGFVGGFYPLNCSDQGFQQAMMAVGVPTDKVIAATYQVVAGTLYVAHCEVNGKVCRVPVWKTLNCTFEAQEDRACCDCGLAAGMTKCAD